MTAPSRLSLFQQECNYDEFVRRIRSAEDVSEESKDQLIKELDGTRHIMIVDMRQFFADAVESGQLEADDEPFALITKRYPFSMLDSCMEVEDATRFCKSVGLSYEIHVYPSISQSVH